MRHAPLVGTLVTLGAIAVAGAAYGAATLIPDHVYRLGTSGGANGPPCTWQCGTQTCGGSACALHGTQGFGAVLTTEADAGPCQGSGVMLTLGLAGRIDGNVFQIRDTRFALCGTYVNCSGREPRACAACNDSDPGHTQCSSDDGAGHFPCPPGDVVFLCKDPCGPTPGNLFVEGDLANLASWFNQTRQPLPTALRNEVPVSSRVIVYHAQAQAVPPATPPRGRMCIRMMSASQSQSLAVCSNNITVGCTSDEDCPGGTCGTGTPSVINDDPINGNISHAACTAADPFNVGLPCNLDEDCNGTPGVCALLPTSAWLGSCSTSAVTECNADGDCPQGETCDSYCDDPACGDNIVDPDEACDDGDTSSGDGCDGSCAVEQGWVCYRTLGQPSLCISTPATATCDRDGTACTADRCSPFPSSPDCLAGPPPICAGAAKAMVQMKTKAGDPSKSQLKWKWTADTDLAAGDLGTPATSTDLALCAIDQTGVLFEATAPAGDTCAGKPCWQEKPKTTLYKDKEATPDGLVKVQANWGVAGKGKLQVQGKGALLPYPSAPFPALALAPPVRVFLARRDAPACWEATFANATKNLPGEFRAKTD